MWNPIKVQYVSASLCENPYFPRTCLHHWEVNSVQQTCSPPAFTHSTHCPQWVVLCLIIISQGQGDFPLLLNQADCHPTKMNSEHCASFLWGDQCQSPEVWHLPVKFCLHKSLGFDPNAHSRSMSPLWSAKITCIASVYTASFLYPFISNGSLMSLLTQGCLSRAFGSAVRITMADMPGTQAVKSFIVTLRLWREIEGF